MMPWMKIAVFVVERVKNGNNATERCNRKQVKLEWGPGPCARSFQSPPTVLQYCIAESHQCFARTAPLDGVVLANRHACGSSFCSYTSPTLLSGVL